MIDELDIERAGNLHQTARRGDIRAARSAMARWVAVGEE
jgi:hypothetical protein